MSNQYRNSRVDQVLTNLSLDYRPEGHIADMVLTMLPVPKWSGIITGYGTAHLQLYNTRVFDRGSYHTVPTVDRTLNNTYVVDNHGVKDFVTERDREEVEQPFMAKADVTMGLKNLLMTEKEFAIASLMTTASTFATDNSETLSGDAQWSDYENSDPLEDFKDAITQVWQAAKRIVNTAIIPFDVLQALRFHPKITNVYGSTGKFEAISVDQLKRAIGIPNILIPSAAYVNASGVETAFWGKDVAVYHKASFAMKHQRTLGYCVKKTGHESRVFNREPADMPNAEMILHDMAYQYKIANGTCGYLIKNAIA